MSDHDIPVVRSQWMWTLDASDQLMQSIGRTRYGLFIAGELPDYARGGSRSGRTLKPGESDVHLVQLDRIIDLTMQGTYTVTVGRHVRRSDGKGTVVRSGPIGFHVSSDDASLDGAIQRLALGPAYNREGAVRSVSTGVSEALAEMARVASSEDDEARSLAREELQKLSEQLNQALKESSGGASE